MQASLPELPDLPRRRALALCLGALFALPWTGLAAEAKPKVGDTFPDLAGFGLEGKLPDLKGKVVVIDFWASWCLPCKQAFKALADFHRQWSDRGLVILAVSVDTKKKDMDAFLKKNPVPFSVVRDAKEQLANRVDVPTMPTSYVLDRTGKIVAIHEGFHGEETRRQYASELEPLLARP